nr:hypothetical protein [Tanacetum cinerariifolium]
MPHKMEAFNHIDFKDVNTNSIPPFVLKNNDDSGKTYYLDSLTLGPEYREDESISKEIRHLMKLERAAKRHKGEVMIEIHELCDEYLTEKELHQLHLDEKALRETLEEQAMDEKEQEKKIRQKQAEDEGFILESGVKFDSDYESD